MGRGMLLRRTIAAAVWAYAVLVLAAWVALRFVGEAWWPTTVALYAPHAVLLAPVPVLAVLIAAVGRRRLLLVVAAAAAWALFPIMGLTVWGPSRSTSGAPRLRVLSFNVDSGLGSVSRVVSRILEADADVVLLQESTASIDAAVAAALPGFATRASTQFFVASRHPIVELHEPAKLTAHGALRSARFVRVTIDTPLGVLDVYNVHPISPRIAMDTVRGDGFLVGLRSGAAFRGDVATITSDAELRTLQARAIASLAAASKNAVLIAGDTNLPGPSRTFAATFGRWQDGFAAVGRGFGYTFPAGRRFGWMRIDRILAGPELRFIRFGVGCEGASDHRCVWADVERASGTLAVR